MIPALTVRLLVALAVTLPVAAQARLAITDKLSTYRRAPSEDRIDFARRMGKSFSSLQPGMDRDYFIRCLEETVNIGDPRDLELDSAVKLCVGAYRAPGERPED